MDTLVSLAIRFPLSGLVGDLHPLDNAHAEHTKSDGRCYGIACNENFILVSEYGKDGSNAELVILKRR